MPMRITMVGYIIYNNHVNIFSVLQHVMCIGIRAKRSAISRCRVYSAARDESMSILLHGGWARYSAENRFDFPGIH